MGERFYVLSAADIVGLRSFSFEAAIQRADALIANDGKSRVIVGFEAEICAGPPPPITTHPNQET